MLALYLAILARGVVSVVLAAAFVSVLLLITFDLDRPVPEDLGLGEETADELVQLERVPARRHDA